MTGPALPQAPPPPAVTTDCFLGDRLRILQPKSGYRAGVDAVLLAASTAIEGGTAATVLDCGAGVGTVGLCVAARCQSARVTLVEREPALLDLAIRNIAHNNLETRVRAIAGDLTAPAMHPAAPRLDPETFDHVLANPPYHDTGDNTAARDHLKRTSHAMPSGSLDSWVRFAARMAKPSGRVTLIHKADALPELLHVLQDRFGNLTVTPIYAYATKSAIRVLVSGIKGSRAPLVINPALVLHANGGAFTPHAGRILRDAAPLLPQHEG